MKSRLTSYSALFDEPGGGHPAVEAVEIPLIQRDYAQGREGKKVERIRRDFLTVLLEAVDGGEAVNLDFVYGDVEAGVLRPLDGQQRLTTLFLLHWYLAWRIDRPLSELGWTRFTYATRATARTFCQRLVANRPPAATPNVSEWITDQPWYLYTWDHDPTVKAMLVMLDAIHERFGAIDHAAAWHRLVEASPGSVTFHLLPLEGMGLNEDLYIKMNSRGKPLTEFENFKARFEELLEGSCEDRVEEVARKIDTTWADVLWPFDGGDHVVDDEFMRYFHFVTDVITWENGEDPTSDVEAQATRLFGPEADVPAGNLDRLVRMFDTWVGVDVRAAFEALFRGPDQAESANGPHRPVLFEAPANLFEACCRDYGRVRGKARDFSLSSTLLLYAVLVHRLEGTADFLRRLRVLRNLLAFAGNELRADTMAQFVRDARELVVTGSLDDLPAFTRARVAEERAKRDLVGTHPNLEPTLHRLEDHPLLQGTLVVFELDPASLKRRADAFLRLYDGRSRYPEVTGALLACGDYSRRQRNERYFQLGSPKNDGPWRLLFTADPRDKQARARRALGALLDAVAAPDIGGALTTVQRSFVDECERAARFDWRYYLVRYPAMRTGDNGVYVGWEGRLRYQICMLRGVSVAGYYRDAYLWALLEESDASGAVEDTWFTGYEHLERWITLKRSRAGIRCVDEGLRLDPPRRVRHRRAWDEVCTRHGVVDGLLPVPQTAGDPPVDTVDRVSLGAALLRDLVRAGC